MRNAALALLLFLTVKPAFAHHAFAAEFDAKKPVKLRGTVTKMEWINPHAWLHIDVKDTDGSVTRWMIELGPPNSLWLLIDAGELAQQANPKRLNLDRITLAWSGRGIICIHPGEMARTPNQRGLSVHPDAVGSAFGVILRDADQHVANVSPGFSGQGGNNDPQASLTICVFGSRYPCIAVHPIWE